MRQRAATLTVLLLTACGGGAATVAPPSTPTAPITTASATQPPSPIQSPLKTLAFTVNPYPGQTAKGNGSIVILSRGYSLTFDASLLTPSAIGGQVVNLHFGTCANPDLSNNQLVATARPDSTGQAHIEINYPTAYALPSEGRVLTIHGSGNDGFTHIACGALPAP